MCGLLDLSPSGYYVWLRRVVSKRAREDAMLLSRIRSIHQRSYGTYGVPRIHAELGASGIRAGRKRVARLMRMAAISGVSRRRAVRTTWRSEESKKAPDLVNRDFSAPVRDRLWVADITYVPTHAGFLYLSVVIYAFSRRVVGWSMANHLRSELVTDALDMALGMRRPHAVIHHSDQGSQYISVAFGKRCRQAGVSPSMGSVGDCYDIALCESFFASLECELLDRKRFTTRTDARLALFQYIEGFYNTRRRHSSLGYLSPMNFERRFKKTA